MEDWLVRPALMIARYKSESHLKRLCGNSENPTNRETVRKLREYYPMGVGGSFICGLQMKAVEIFSNTTHKRDCAKTPEIPLLPVSGPTLAR